MHVDRATGAADKCPKRGFMNSPAIRSAATSLALIAMLLRALLPAGWMPATTGAHHTTLVICTMNGPKRVSLPDEPTKKQPSHEDRENGPCPFGAAATAFAPPAPVALVLPCAVNEPSEQPVAIACFHAAPPSGALGPRSPPFLV